MILEELSITKEFAIETFDGSYGGKISEKHEFYRREQSLLLAFISNHTETHSGGGEQK